MFTALIQVVIGGGTDWHHRKTIVYSTHHYRHTAGKVGSIAKGVAKTVNDAAGYTDRPLMTSEKKEILFVARSGATETLVNKLMVPAPITGCPVKSDSAFLSHALLSRLECLRNTHFDFTISVNGY
jgi:hypothetical protein